MDKQETTGQEAMRANREHARFDKLHEVLAQLEPVQDTIAVDPQKVALSSAISLKRIADALQPTVIKGEPATLKPGEMAVWDFDGKRIDDLNIESVAGDALNITDDEIAHAPVGELKTLIRGLASAVLRKANK